MMTRVRQNISLVCVPILCLRSMRWQAEGGSDPQRISSAVPSSATQGRFGSAACSHPISVDMRRHRSRPPSSDPPRAAGAVGEARRVNWITPSQRSLKEPHGLLGREHPSFSALSVRQGDAGCLSLIRFIDNMDNGPIDLGCRSPCSTSLPNCISAL